MIDTTNHKFPKKLSEKLYFLMREGIKTEGSFDPDKILYIFEESLTFDELKTVCGFLKWVHEPNIGLGKWEHGPREFGSGNYQERYQEFLTDTKSKAFHARNK